MKDAKKSRKVKDIKVKNQVTADNIGPVKPAKAGGPVSFVEVEEATILINPDVDSMESRG